MFHVENQSGKKGDIVSVPVTMESKEDVGGFDITVYYNGDTLEFRSLKWGGLIEDEGVYDYNHKEDSHSIKIIYVTADTVQANGTVAILEFVLKKDCTEELPIGIGDRQVVGNEEDSSFIPSSVTGVDETFQSNLEANVSDSGAADHGAADAETSESQASGISQTEESTKQTDDVAAPFRQGESERNGKNDFVVSAAAGIGCALVILVAALWMLWKRKRNKK